MLWLVLFFQITALLFLACLAPWYVMSIVLGGHGSNCMVGSCNCSISGLLDCSNRGFAAIPTFNQSRHEHFNLLTLQFASNNLTTIRDSAFLSLYGVHTVYIRLILSDNRISSIADRAFNGIESKISEILLRNNLLHTIPDAMTHMHYLHTLDIVNNPIGNFDGLTNLREHLNKLSMGHQNMTEWPTSSLKRLNHLHKLSIQDTSITTIPKDAFYKWSEITNLSLKGNKLYDFPTESLCDLKNLQSLEYSFNQVHAPDTNFFKPCAHGFYMLTELILDNDDFYQTPTDIFGIFPQLSTLRIRGSKLLSNLDDLTVPSGNQLQTLDLSGNNLAAIPEVIMRMPQLTAIDVSGNPIACSCFMGWMKTWPKRDNVTITGTCAGGEQIRRYIDNSLLNFC